MLNRVILIGRLTRDPELRYTPAGVAVTQFTLAVDRPFTRQGGEREADFIPIVTWRQLAEACANHLKKGIWLQSKVEFKYGTMKIMRVNVYT